VAELNDGLSRRLDEYEGHEERFLLRLLRVFVFLRDFVMNRRAE